MTSQKKPNCTDWESCCPECSEEQALKSPVIPICPTTKHVYATLFSEGPFYTKTLRPPGGRAPPPHATCAVITDCRAPLASGPEFGETIYCHGFWGPGMARPAPPTPVGPGAAGRYAEHVSGLRARSSPGPRCPPKAELPSKQVCSPKVKTQHSRSCRFPHGASV